MAQVILIAAALAAAAGVAFILLHHGGSSATPTQQGWTANTDGNDYGATVDPATGSFTFPFAPNGVHYVTKACGSLSGKARIRLKYRIDAADAVRFLGCKDGLPVLKGPYLYYQRGGDDWSGAGEYETYRWWASFAPGDMTPGEHEIVAPLSGRWTAVMASNSIDKAATFQAALVGAARCGFTFPNNEGLGHGVYAAGPAAFTVLEFAVE